MTPFDENAVFVKVDKLRDRMSRLGNHTNPDEWQNTRLLMLNGFDSGQYFSFDKSRACLSNHTLVFVEFLKDE